MKHVLIALVVSALTCSAALAQQGDKRILAARDALRTGDRISLERLAGWTEDHPLDHYVPYWLLMNRLARPDPVPDDELTAYVSRHAGSIPAVRLQAQWLRRLAQDQDWAGFMRQYAEHAAPDEELRCLSWQARHLLMDRAVLDEVAAAWSTLTTSPAACDGILQTAIKSGKVSEDEAWWRFRRQIDSRNPEAARTTLNWLGVNDTRALDPVLNRPADYLDRLPADFHRIRVKRELALAALVRLARQDVPPAHVRFLRQFEKFSEEEQAYMYASLGYLGALSRLPLTTEWYRAAGDTPMTPLQREWRVRAAIRARDWNMVEGAIGKLHISEQTDPEWMYWLARAHAERGDVVTADKLLRTIADGYGYYPMLAADELGRSFVAPKNSELVSPENKARAANDPGIRRALAFYRLGLPTEAVREWIHTLRGKDREFILAAAHLALDNGLLDRAINTAELADAGNNFEIRFLTPFRDLVEPQAIKQQLDLAWVYGLMRQESRFNIPARSGAGAQGLMQVMPETGRWVAKRIGMEGYHPGMLNDPKTNVMLGTNYLRMILSDLDEHPVLASAGYNAGPSRAKRWRGDEAIEAAIYIATIPIDETRDYVQKVLVNKVVYAAMLEGRPQSLKARLGMIPASVRADATIK